jgi:3-phenylpropionate/trans-cinnamate dioxygenase ferredoxin reductase subunit
VTQFDIAIVGAGQAGAQAAIQLRQLGYSGSIGLIGAEPDLPYERPPLSKEYLAGEKEAERLLIRPPSFWEERQISMRLGMRVDSVDPTAQVLKAAGEHLSYGTLIWAAGGVPRRLRCAGGELKGVHVVRSRADVDAIRAELGAASRIAIVGGGYVGLEAAAVLRKLGKEVVLVEALDRLLPRVAGPEISNFFEAEHRAQGVAIRLGASVERIEEDAGRARGVTLGNGETIDADMVIVGIGIDAAAGPLRAAGAAGTTGIDVDSLCRTSLPGIYAIGDCAAHENPFAGGRRIRLESVQNAHDQAAVAAKAILGVAEPYSAIPWFWSNQYDLKLQTVGLSIGYDAAIIRGAPAERSFSLIYLREGRVIALDCVNATRDYVQGRKLILEGAAIAPDRLADAATPLKALI